ncbi:MAG: ABC transporter substrate-binding protein, partial [Bdellovibrionota bacterium]
MGRLLITFLFPAFLLSACQSKTESEISRANLNAPKVQPVTARLGMIGRVQGLDPGQANDAATLEEVSRVFETLLTYDYFVRPYRLTPLLAAALPEANPEGLTYRIKLKSGVLFQDCTCFTATGGRGRELTASDVEYTFKRAADPQYSHAGWQALKGRIDGLDAWREAAMAVAKTDYAVPVSGLKILDRYTIEFSLRKAYVNFPFVLAMPSLDIVPREAVEAGGRSFGLSPVGTGPFLLAKLDPLNGIEWVRNPTFRSELALDGLIIRFFSESDAHWKAFDQGDLDLIEVPASVFGEIFTPVKTIKPEHAKRGWNLHNPTRLDTTYLGFWMKDPVLGQSRALRQAISLAIKPEILVDLFYNGRAVPAEGPIPPGMGGYDPKFKNAFRSFHLGRARELFSRTGLAEAFAKKPLTIGVETWRAGEKFGEMILKSLATIGISAEIRAFPWHELRAAIA